MTAVEHPVVPTARRRRRWLDLSIRAKLFLLSAVLLVLLVAVAGMGLTRMGTVKRTGSEVRVKWLPSIEALDEFETAAADLRIKAYHHVAAVDAADMTATEQSIIEQLAAMDDDAAAYERTISSAEEQDLWDRFQAQWATYLQEQEAAIELSREGRTEEAAQALISAMGSFDAARALIDDDVALNRAGATAAAETAESTYDSARIALLVLAGLAIAVGAALALKISGEIAKRLRATAEVLDQVRDGDFRVRLGFDSDDELGRMGQALDATVASTQRALEAIGEQSEALAAAAEELSAVATQLNTVVERTSLQAELVSSASVQASTSVSTVAAGSEEMGATVAEISRTATEAAGVVADAVALTTGAATVVNRLGEASREIDKVVDFISGIAAQTNLLALNATIEAARAGEAGRGFAVVANEVKDLAAETAQATEQIRQTIDAIQRDATGAVESMTKVNRVITSINDNQVTISSAVEEQAATTAEISRNAAEVAVATSAIADSIQEVAAAAGETGQSSTQVSATAHDVARMASDMRALVAQFRL